MTKISVLGFAFYAFFAVANLIAFMHIFFVTTAAWRGEFSVYNYWLEYIVISLCVLIVISNLLKKLFKYRISILFYLALIISTLYTAPYAKDFHDVGNWIISSSTIITVIGLILPLLGLSISIIALHQYQDNRPQ
ncbi:MAG: hypothetical protein V4564_17855 [Pseudomonadota bacterium]